MVVATEHPHIVSDASLLGGEPIIRGTRTTVRAIVELWRLGTSPEDIPAHLPHLTLGQIFDALSYYADHADDIDGFIVRNRVDDALVHEKVRNRA